MLLFEMRIEFLKYVELYRAKDTLRFYHDHLDVIVDFLGNIDSSELNKVMLEDFIRWQKSKVCNGTINKRLTALKTMFNHLNILNQDLFYIKNLTHYQIAYDCFYGNDLKKLINYINSSSLSSESKLILSLFLETGIRLNEIICIKVENINFEHRTIKLISTKNKKIRYVCYGDLTAEYISLFKSRCYLISLKKTGIQSLMRRVTNKVGFKIHSHMFRHTYASILNINDSNLYYIMQCMGHSSLDMTARYIHSNLIIQKKKYDQFFNIENYI